MKIFVTGAAPWVNSGYGKPWRYLFPRLHAAGHELAMAPFFGWRGNTSTIEIGGAPVKFYTLARDQFFNDVIEHHVAEFGADVVITMQDVWTLTGWGNYNFRWCPNFPIDTQPVSGAILEAIEGCQTPLVNTRWAQRELFQHGWMNARYVPYSIDTDIYKPGSHQAARELMGIPEGAFVAGMIAANSSYPSRKSFPEVILAFRDWLAVGNDGFLYLHTTITPKRKSGVQFVPLLQSLGIDWSTIDDPDPERRARAKILFPSQHRMWSGAVDDTELAQLYQGLDVLLSPSQAEGFGIPIIEAQACGIPVVTTNITSMPELTFAGLCLEPAQLMWEQQGGWRACASVGAITDALNWAAALTTEEREMLSDTGVIGASDFDFDVCVERDWLPFLDELAAGDS